MPNFDHLCTLPEYFTGKVLSVKPIENGQSFIICDDSGFDFLGSRRRWVGDTKSMAVPVEVRKGDLCRFLPGVATKKGRLPRAFNISIIDLKGAKQKFPRSK